MNRPTVRNEAAAVIERTARKDYRCARQVYFDRLSPESREWHRASPCPHGGVIRAGERYAETEGVDAFHPTRQHLDCEEWTA